MQLIFHVHNLSHSHITTLAGIIISYLVSAYYLPDFAGKRYWFPSLLEKALETWKLGMKGGSCCCCFRMGQTQA